MKCKYFKKENGDKYCSNYLGPQVIETFEKETFIKHNCKDRCKYADCNKFKKSQELKGGDKLCY